MSNLADRATALYDERKDSMAAAKAQRLEDTRSKVRHHAERLLRLEECVLDVELSGDGSAWIFRHDGMVFWAKHRGGQKVWQLYVVSVNGNELPFDTLEQLGMWIRRGSARRDEVS